MRRKLQLSKNVSYPLPSKLVPTSQKKTKFSYFGQILKNLFYVRECGNTLVRDYIGNKKLVYGVSITLNM